MQLTEATENISIHAPLTGSDTLTGESFYERTDFNPRSPYGERPYGIHYKHRSHLFQSTLPLRAVSYTHLTLPTT